MKYIIIKTDIFISGSLHREGSIIDSADHSQEDIASLKHLLVPVDRKSEMVITLDQIAAEKTSPVSGEAIKPVSKRGRKKQK